MSFRDMAETMNGVMVNTVGEPATYIPKTGASKPIECIFNLRSDELDPQLGVVVSSEKPTAGIRLSDLDSEPVKGDRISVRDVTYFVRTHEPDGLGGTLLILSEE